MSIAPIVMVIILLVPSTAPDARRSQLFLSILCKTKISFSNDRKLYNTNKTEVMEKSFAAIASNKRTLRKNCEKLTNVVKLLIK